MEAKQILGYDFNKQQEEVLQLIANFIKDNFMNPKIIPNGDRGNIRQLSYEQISQLSRFPRFLLTGSAGTGKTSIITYLIFAGWFNVYPPSQSPRYIIAAPTNKAKDVLMNKFNMIKNKVIEIINSDPEIKSEFTSYLIHTKSLELVQFKTLSQVLGINSQINKDGQQEFTKGNIFRIQKRFAKKEYVNTIIVIDECSMIDSDSFKLVQQIPKPVIFMGDPCQLPPVNEDFSNVFSLPDYDSKLGFYMLTEVMRSKDLITNCCNYMRDIILGMDKDNKNINLDNIYKKYVVPDPKNKNIKYYIKDPKKWFAKYVTRCLKDKVSNDMGICYTNKRCQELNNRMRGFLFKQIKDGNGNSNGDIDGNTTHYEGLNDPPYIMYNEKIIVKSPYYVYENKCYNSLILRIYNFKEAMYKPLSFLEWIKQSCNMIELKNEDALTNEDFDKLLEEALNSKEQREQNEGTLFSFGFNTKSGPTSSLSDEEIMKRQRDVFTNIIRDRFYVSHNYDKNRKEWYDYKSKSTIIPEEKLENDPFIKLETIISEGKKGKIASKEDDHSFLLRPSYSNIHSNLTEYAYGIPLDKINCSVCLNLSPYIQKLVKECDSLAMDMVSLTNKCNMGCYICTGCDSMKKHYRFAVISEDYLDKYNMLKKRVLSILSKCSNKKINITRRESTQFKSGLDDEVVENLLNALGPYHQENGVIKSIPYSLLFGHYWNHMFVDPILEWDYGYFITTHKSQGSDYDQVFVDGNNLMKNTKLTEKDKLIYTGLSRAKSKLNVYL
jgi:hypothetical protein